MPETEIVKGKIVSVIPWKSNKGFFLNLENDSNDYYKFGKQSANPGDVVEMEVKEGTGNFDDKLEIVKIGAGGTETEKPTEKKQDKDKSFNELAGDGLKVYMDKQNIIVEQCCLKAAAEVVGHLIPRAKVQDWPDIAKDVNFLKREFVADIIANQDVKK